MTSPGSPAATDPSPAAAVRESFAEQARWAERLGSPFNARLCRGLAAALDRETAIGRRVLDWPGDAWADALALRLCGGLHALVRRGAAPELAALYPPAPLPNEDALARTIAETLRARGAALDPWLDSPPQTNEVGRSALLMAGLLTIADRFRMPLRLLELGASAGLNLQLDRYAYDLGGRAAGRAGSPLLLAPEWRGPPPPAAPIEIAGRGGVDLNPLDPAADGERLLAYVWPDQPRRLAQLAAALALAEDAPPPVARGDAADWLEARLPLEGQEERCQVVMHSVAFGYFPDATQQRVAARLEQAGAQATEAAPLAWLRFEKLPEDEHFSLRLRTWPGEDRLLAWAQPHGAWVEWLTGSAPARR